MAIKLFDKVARNQGLVLYLPFMEGTGSSVHDLSKYHNNGTITGATWTQLPSGIWVLSFDGVDDYGYSILVYINVKEQQLPGRSFPRYQDAQHSVMHMVRLC